MSDYEFIDMTQYEKQYTEYTPVTKQCDPHLAIHEHYEYDGTPKSNLPQYITYIDHPTVIVEENTKDDSDEEREPLDMNFISQFYFGSLTIVGLFIVFRILQLKK